MCTLYYCFKIPMHHKCASFIMSKKKKKYRPLKKSTKNYFLFSSIKCKINEQGLTEGGPWSTATRGSTWTLKILIKLGHLCDIYDKLICGFEVWTIINECMRLVQ